MTRLRRTTRRSRKHNRHLRRLNSIVRQIFAIPKKVGNAIWTRVLKRTQNARATSANHKLLPTDKPRHNTTRQDKRRQNRTGLNKSAHSGQLNVTRAIVADFVFGARSEVHSSCALRPCLTVATQSFVVCGNMFGFLGANVVIRIKNCLFEKFLPSNEKTFLVSEKKHKKMYYLLANRHNAIRICSKNRFVLVNRLL